MAKNKNVESQAIEEEFSPVGSKKKSKKGLIFFLFLLLVMIGVGFVFRKPISHFMSSKFKNVPVIGKFFKETDSPKKKTKEEIELELKTLQQENSQLKTEIENYKTKQATLETKVESLQQYETKYSDFLKQKEEWDTNLAKANSDLYISQFEAIYPDLAEKIYKELKGEELITKEQKAYAKAIGEMDDVQAAKALELLVSTDPELIKMIFANMNQERESLILSSMTSEKAAQVIKLISPEL